MVRPEDSHPTRSWRPATGYAQRKLNEQIDIIEDARADPAKWKRHPPGQPRFIIVAELAIAQISPRRGLQIRRGNSRRCHQIVNEHSICRIKKEVGWQNRPQDLGGGRSTQGRPRHPASLFQTSPVPPLRSQTHRDLRPSFCREGAQRSQKILSEKPARFFCALLWQKHALRLYTERRRHGCRNWRCKGVALTRTVRRGKFQIHECAAVEPDENSRRLRQRRLRPERWRLTAAQMCRCGKAAGPTSECRRLQEEAQSRARCSQRKSPARSSSEALRFSYDFSRVPGAFRFAASPHHSSPSGLNVGVESLSVHPPAERKQRLCLNDEPKPAPARA